MSMETCIPDYVVNIKTHRSMSCIQRVARVLGLLSSNNHNERENWEKECTAFDVIILFDTRPNYAYYAEKIEKACKNTTRLVLYFWNPISYSSDFKKLSPRWELCTFSRDDAFAYKMRYVETFYNPQWPEYQSKEITNDVFFIGTEKGRGEILSKVKSELQSRDLRPDFRIADNRKALYSKKYSRYLPYQEVIKLIHKSRAILEILQTGQTGLSLRCMESLYFNKKLITNNVSIRQSVLYSPDRVFIIGIDTWDNIEEFLFRPIAPISQKLKDSFSFDALITRIVNKQEFNYSHE